VILQRSILQRSGGEQTQKPRLQSGHICLCAAICAQALSALNAETEQMHAVCCCICLSACPHSEQKQSGHTFRCICNVCAAASADTVCALLCCCICVSTFPLSVSERKTSRHSSSLACVPLHVRKHMSALPAVNERTHKCTAVCAQAMLRDVPVPILRAGGRRNTACSAAPTRACMNLHLIGVYYYPAPPPNAREGQTPRRSIPARPLREMWRRWMSLHWLGTESLAQCSSVWRPLGQLERP
jgi:hypothetical protein